VNGTCGLAEANEHQDATASMETGIGAVLKFSQIPELVDCLNLVATRIDQQWERDGEEYFGDAPDDNDPEVIRQRRIDQPVLNEKIA